MRRSPSEKEALGSAAFVKGSAKPRAFVGSLIFIVLNGNQLFVRIGEIWTGDSKTKYSLKGRRMKSRLSWK